MKRKRYKSKKLKRDLRAEKRKGRIGLIPAVLILLITVMSSGTISAYLLDSDKAVNELKVGGNRIELVEEFTPPSKLEPGISFQKDVKAKNVGPNDCYVRIKAVFTDSDMEKYCTVDFNTKDFVYNEDDGYYYYKKVLVSGESSPSLFTTVTLSEEIPADEIKDFDILIYMESYQSAEFNNYAEAWRHYHRNKPE